MMISKASVKFARISPRKVRYVIDLIRKKPVGEAQAILNGAPRRAADIVRKLLNQALDAAEKNSKMAANGLYVARVTADGGPMMKRFRAASMGRATSIRKRTSHIHLQLDALKAALTAAGTKTAEKPKAAKAKPAAIEASKTASKKKESKKLVGAK